MNTDVVALALIVDGLALSVTSQELRQLFTPFGPVVWARVVVDRFGRSLRYGYLVMSDESDAAKAIETLTGRTIAGFPITVSLTTIPPLPRIA